MRLLTFLVVVATSLVGAPDPARAQTGAVVDEAREAFEAGQAAFEAERYREALRLFERAYALTDATDLLYNISLTRRRLGEWELALSTLERYHARAPANEDREAVEAELRELRAHVRRMTSEQGAVEESGASDDWMPWVVVGGSGVVLLTGVALLGAAQADISTVENGTRWEEIRGAHGRVPVLSGMGFALLGLGLAGAAGGLVWALWGEEPSAEDTADAALAPGRRSGAALSRGRLRFGPGTLQLQGQF